MLTVGYGDILPVNHTEMLVSTVNMMIACSVFGFFLNAIGNIVQQYFSVETQIKDKMDIITKYMVNKNVSKAL